MLPGSTLTTNNACYPFTLTQKQDPLDSMVFRENKLSLTDVCLNQPASFTQETQNILKCAGPVLVPVAAKEIWRFPHGFHNVILHHRKNIQVHILLQM